MAVTTATHATTEKAGFFTRALALIIDAILVTIVATVLSSLVLGGAEPSRSSGLNTLVGLVYYLYFWSAYGHGQTLGMRALNIRVVKTDGTEITLVTALIRYVGLIISFLVVFIGVIWVAFDADKQGWHDKIAGTYVVKA